jgi:hypothetical protein
MHEGEETMSPMKNRRKWRSRAAKERAKYHGRFVKVKHWTRNMEAARPGSWEQDTWFVLIRSFKGANAEQFGMAKPVVVDLDQLPLATGEWRNQQINGVSK